MNNPTTKAEVLDAIESSHQDMMRLLAALSAEERTAPVFDDGWSVKDHLAHINAWENMTIGWTEASLRGENVQRYAPGFTYSNDDEAESVMHRLNDHLYEQNRERSWDEVIREFRRTHQRILDRVKALSEQDIFDPNRFAWRQGNPLIGLLEGNTYGHYREHIGWIQARLPKSRGA